MTNRGHRLSARRRGIDTGVDLDNLIAMSVWLESILGRKLEGYVYRAGTGRDEGLTEP